MGAPALAGWRASLRIVYVEDHEVTRVGMLALLKKIHPEVEIVEVPSFAELRECATRVQDADLLLLDLGLPDLEGPLSIESVRSMFPDMPVAVLSGYDSAALMLAAIKSGASGFIVKNSSVQTISNALELILDGEVFFPKHLVSDLVNDPRRSVGPGVTVSATELEADQHLSLAHVHPPSVEATLGAEKLTSRQQEVTRLVALGLPNKEIARALSISLGTAKNHVAEVLRLLNCSNRKELIYKILASGK